MNLEATATVARVRPGAITTTPTKPRRWPLMRHSLVLAKRGVINTIRTPEALIDVTLQPIIFLLMFTYIFGGAIAHGSQHDYLQFLLPGILGQTIAMGGIAIGVNLNNDVTKGIFDRFRSLPIARSAPLVGAVLADVVRYVILCVVTLGFGYMLGFRAHTSMLDLVAACVLAVGFALCLCWASVFVGMIARTSGSVQGIMTLIVLPLSFGSNTFVPTNSMPGWLQSFVNLNPLTHLVGAIRGLLLGGPVASNMLWTLLWMGILLVLFVPLALRAYRRRV
jgi:oleandomycin transport system permease protein